MATLKTFEEGDTIYASETNANNQALLSLLTDNAVQVQKYVEGEVASIKSNVASVQQTLQNNIDALDAKKPIYIIEQGGNSSTWYKIYSNGWCEQGGKTTVTWNQAKNVTLLKPYKDTNYFVIASFSHRRNTDDNVMPNIISKAAIGLYVSTVGAESISWSGEATWETKGYVEVTNG